VSEQVHQRVARPVEQPVEHSPRACDGALARAFGFLGKRWNGILLATLGHGSAGFSDLRRTVTGISDSVLSDRLSELARAGLVSRTVHEGPPVSVVYDLTDAGRALTPALQELTLWANENLPPEQCAGQDAG
jgi:DNA-binding HxlR family transcriptional regulator